MQSLITKQIKEARDQLNKKKRKQLEEDLNNIHTLDDLKQFIKQHLIK